MAGVFVYSSEDVFKAQLQELETNTRELLFNLKTALRGLCNRY